MSTAFVFILACLSLGVDCNYTIYNDSHQTIVGVSTSRLYNPIPPGGSDDVTVAFRTLPDKARTRTHFAFKNGKGVTTTLDPCRIRSVRVNDTLATLIMPTPKPGKTP